jgi:hypothetical protein
MILKQENTKSIYVLVEILRDMEPRFRVLNEP